MSAPLTMNCGGRLVDFGRPLVMGILNATPDSFYAGCRATDAAAIAARAEEIVRQGGDIIDVGACSTRPGAEQVGEAEERERLRLAFTAIREAVGDTVLLSVDTWRASVAEECVERFGAHIINDISGGTMDAGMAEAVARLHVPYVLSHIQGTPETMQCNPHYDDLLREVCLFWAERVERLHRLGVCDILLDPGFGFGKTLRHNYELLGHLADLKAEFGLPLLVGVSRKSMAWRLLGCAPQEALNATTALNMLALTQGADIIRAHDVREAVEAVAIWRAYREPASIVQA